MAANLDRKEDGTATVFSVRETPWHKEGHVLAEAPTFDAALELAGHNYTVELAPMVARRAVSENTDTVDLSVPDHFAIVRADRNVILDVVGARYTPLQNRDAFSVLLPLLDSGMASLETGGTLDGGRDAWMLAKFNIEDARVQEVFGSEGIVPFATIVNNHTGERAVTVMETPVRIVCQNTVLMALADRQSRKVYARHTLTVGTRTVDAARELFSNITSHYVEIANAFATLRHVKLTEELFTKLVLDTVAKMPNRDDFEQEGRFISAHDKAEGRRDVVASLWKEGTGHKGDASAYEALQAVVEGVDHYREQFGVSKRGELDVMFGKMAEIKQNVATVLLDYAATAPVATIVKPKRSHKKKA